MISRDSWQLQTLLMKPCRSFLRSGPKPSAEKNSINRSAKCSKEQPQKFHSATQVEKRDQAQSLVQQLRCIEFSDSWLSKDVLSNWFRSEVMHFAGSTD